MSTAFGHVTSEDHSTYGHPESPQRIIEVMNLLETTGLLQELMKVDIKSVTKEQLARVHSQTLIDQVKLVSERGGGYLDPDTYSTSTSYQSALNAAGTTCAILDHIMEEDVRNGFSLVRPPGHHADVDRVGGFCLFNNVATATRQAQFVHGADRVLIVDFDVHHGNGTQDIFYDDPSVLLVSIHQYHHFFYPGTGDIDEIGIGPGEGYTINVPFPPGAGDRAYRRVFKELLVPKANEFRPDVLLVSAGFDAHWIDPLASAALSLKGYSEIATQLINMADHLCDGKILFVLEGGYQPTALAHGVLNVLYRLLGQDDISDPLGPAPDPEADMTMVMSKLRSLHLPN